MNFKEIGVRIRACRKAKGYTQQELGNLVGVTKGSISHWEVGRCDSIEGVYIFNLAKALDCTQDYILTGKTEVTQQDMIDKSKISIVRKLNDLVTKGLNDYDYAMFERMIENVTRANHMTPVM
jgi:transcriptional regulator with XRE-family HTH domain